MLCFSRVSGGQFRLLIRTRKLFVFVVSALAWISSESVRIIEFRRGHSFFRHRLEQILVEMDVISVEVDIVRPWRCCIGSRKRTDNDAVDTGRTELVLR